MYFYHNIENDFVINVEQIYARQKIIQHIKKRFGTFGYQEVTTSAFEEYDLYAKMNGTVNHQEMIKTIDNTGKVLVLRPDITIPITQQIALNNGQIQKDLRYFYVSNVFRQASETKEYRESTQAGVEYFGNPSPDADAEIIALAIELLKDFNAANFKIELGHAGFFKQIVQEMKLPEEDLAQLKEYIQAKNITEINQFLNRLPVQPEVVQIVSSLPFLYGNPLDVIAKAKELPLNENLKKTLANIEEIYEVLEAYGVNNHVVIDLSLINHMDYYSDMIFQGFIEKVGKPILMGGRYDTLANQFDANLPAIGFACDVDALILGIEQSELPQMNPNDAAIFFDKKSEKRGRQLAAMLRDDGYRVVTYPIETENSRVPEAQAAIKVEQERNVLSFEGNEHAFYKNEEVLSMLNEMKERK